LRYSMIVQTGYRKERKDFAKSAEDSAKATSSGEGIAKGFIEVLLPAFVAAGHETDQVNS
jgi:hypothetical protein